MTWSDRISNWSALLPDRTIFSDDRTSISFSALEQNTRELGNILSDVGFKASDRVILALPRSASSAVCLASLLRSEIAGLTIDRGQIASTFERLHSFVKPRAVFCLDADAALISSSMRKSEVIPISPRHTENAASEVVLVIDRDAGTNPSPSELRWMLQTSGSTRSPRVVMISRENLATRADGEVRDFGLSDRDIIINFLSYSHDLGLNQVLSTIASGATLRIQSQPFVASLIPMLAEPGVTGISGTPLLWTQMMAQTSTPIQGLRYITVSGGSLSRRQLLDLARLFPGAEVIRTYGQTETFRTLISRDLGNTSQGNPILGVTVRLLENGELVHSGAGEMIGYLNDSDSSKSLIENKGVRTGDLFSKRDDGFHYVGRNDDMIKRFEARVHIKEIELTISELPTVVDVAIVARPAAEGDTRQTLLNAFIQTRNDVELSAVEIRDQILNHCKSQLASYKIPDVVTFLTEFPRTASAKIDRQTLLKQWSDQPVPKI